MPSLLTRGSGSLSNFGFSVSSGGSVTLIPFNGMTQLAEMGGSTSAYYMSDVVYSASKNLWVAVGTNGSSMVYATSTDGYTWAAPQVAPGTNITGFPPLCRSETTNQYVAVGYNSSTYPTVTYSTNGINWSSGVTIGTVQFTPTAIAFSTKANIYCVSGYFSNNAPGYMTCSSSSLPYFSNPQTFTGHTSAAPAWGVAYSPTANNFVVAAQLGNLAYSDSNGQNFNMSTAPSGGALTLYDVVWSPNFGEYIATGFDTSVYHGSYYTSTNGITWSGPSSMATNIGIYSIRNAVIPTGNVIAVARSTSSFLTASVFDGTTWHNWQNANGSNQIQVGNGILGVAANTLGFITAVSSDNANIVPYFSHSY
jgi:hypothetical protein